MAVIPTTRNFVYAYDYLPEDAFVQTLLTGTEGRYVFSTKPIDEYYDAVAFAVSIADMMEHGVTVLPITFQERIKQFPESARRAFANMPDEKHEELRRLGIKSMLEVMRDCKDHAVRVEAYDVLLTYCAAA